MFHTKAHKSTAIFDSIEQPPLDQTLAAGKQNKIICTLCREHEKSGFVEGIKVGIRLTQELSDLKFALAANTNLLIDAYPVPASTIGCKAKSQNTPPWATGFEQKPQHMVVFFDVYPMGL